MTAKDRRDTLNRLAMLGQVLLDARLAEVRQASEACNASLARLADLQKQASCDGLPAIAAQEVALRYERWADLRRAEINLTLARQTASWLEARQSASQAFGKSQALEGLVRRST